jgi:hypothetical protein
MDDRITVEPWRIDQTKVHVYTSPAWRDDHRGCCAFVSHDLTLDEVKEIIALSNWGENALLANCDVLRDLCRDILSAKRLLHLNRMQIGTLGFPAELVNELTPIEVCWLHVQARQHRIDQASYAQNPFIDPIHLDPDELWENVADFFEAKFPGRYRRE